MRALRLIRGKKPSIAPVIFAAKPAQADETQHSKIAVGDEIVWQQRPQWLRKPGARQNLWN